MVRSGVRHECPSLFPHPASLSLRRTMSHYVFDARTATDQFPGIGRYGRSLTAALIPLLSADEQLTLLSNPTGSAAWTLNYPAPATPARPRPFL